VADSVYRAAAEEQHFAQLKVYRAGLREHGRCERDGNWTPRSLVFSLLRDFAQLSSCTALRLIRKLSSRFTHIVLLYTFPIE
jgi:hypothetical protein